MATRAPLPSGTVTLLFTDIEGSTQHWEERPEAMASALRRHDELLRAEIERHGGHVFKTIGDAFCAAFARRVGRRRAAARRAARDRRATIGARSADLQVRMALHSGATDERDGDYFGPALNRVARLLAIGARRPDLVSGATAQLLRGLLPPQTGLRDLGEHRLKDLIEPEHVWQLVAAGSARPVSAARVAGFAAQQSSAPVRRARRPRDATGRDRVAACASSRW